MGLRKGLKGASSRPTSKPAMKMGKKGGGKCVVTDTTKNGCATAFKTRRRKSIKQEDRLAEDLGGHRVIMSGAGYEKGDVKGSGYCFEAKRTDRKSYSITEKVVSKAYEEAVSTGMKFAMSVEIGGFSDPSVPNDFIILDRRDFNEMLRLAKIGMEVEENEGES